MIRGRKTGGIEIDNIVARLKKKFEQDVVNFFVRDKRYDLLAGYLQSVGSLQTNNEIFSQKKLIVLSDGCLAIKRENSNFPLANEVIRNNGTGNRYVAPNLEWKNLSRHYVTDAYINELMELQEKVIEIGSGWDAIAFASRVPFASIDALEDKVISTNDSLLILAFANDVGSANIDKLRKAIEGLANKSVDGDKYEIMNHIAEFHVRFGFGKQDNLQEKQPEA